MKIALVVHQFPKLSESFIVRKAIGLVEAGHDVGVFCRRSDPDDWAAFPDLGDSPRWRGRVRAHDFGPSGVRTAAGAGWTVATLLASSPSATVDALRSLRPRLGLRSLLQLGLDAPLIRWRPDVIHVEFGTLARDRVYLRRVLGVPMVVSFRGFDLAYAGLDDPDYYASVWRDADAAHVLSRALENAAAHRGCPRGFPCAVIPPALDPARHEPRAKPAPSGGGRPLRVLSVGRLHWTKGHEYSIQAVRLLRDRGVEVDFRIVGEGPLLEALAFARREMALEADVEFLGARAGDEVRAQMEWADVLLHGAVSEGFCNAVLEAQAMQLPVVCTDAGGLPENVRDSETGIVVPRRDPGALADGLERLARDPDLRERMGRAGRLRVVEHFQIDGQIRAFEALYRRLTDTPGAA